MPRPSDAVAFHFAEEPGPHGVGLRVVEQYDHSRSYRSAVDELGQPFEGECARPLQTLIWYPAGRASSPPMTVSDYLDLWATERSFGAPQRSTRAQQWRAAMAPTVSTALWAVKDAPPLRGRYPVVIYSPGHSSPAWDNADLCEYLASHGYVVLACPSLGATNWDPTLDVAGIEPQARDISFLIGYARSLPNTDLSQVAVAGFSWGGICNVFAAARDNRIKALVCLDGSLRFSPGLVRQAGDVLPERMTIPLLSIAQGQWSPEEQALTLDAHPTHAGPDVLNAWIHGDLVTVQLLGFGHGEHSSMCQRNEDEWRMGLEFYGARKVDYGREDGITGYVWLARYTLQFLNAYLKQDPAGLTFLKKTPVENGVPRRFMTTIFRAATGPCVSFETFRAELHRQGYGEAPRVYARFRQLRADFVLDEQTLGNWAGALMERDQRLEAIAILELSAQLYPDSGLVHLQLGDAYRSSGRESAAVGRYRIAMEKQPSWIALRATLKLTAAGQGSSSEHETAP